MRIGVEFFSYTAPTAYSIYVEWMSKTMRGATGQPDHAKTDAERGRFETGMDLELGEDVLDVGPDGVGAHAEPGADRLAVHALGQQRQHLSLPGSELGHEKSGRPLLGGLGSGRARRQRPRHHHVAVDD